MNFPSGNNKAKKLYVMITNEILPSGSNKDTVNDE
jgi:hypothetical protein